MTQQTRGLAELFDLQRTGQDIWVGLTDGIRLPQLFGDQLVGQSIIAAGAGVEGKSVHTTFLRGGRSGAPVTFRTDRLREGRTISTREVSAWQDDRLLCCSMISCAVESHGLSHSRPAPATPGPDECPDLREVAEAGGGLGDYWEDFAAIEVRVAPKGSGVHPRRSSGSGPPRAFSQDLACAAATTRARPGARALSGLEDGPREGSPFRRVIYRSRTARVALTRVGGLEHL